MLLQEFLVDLEQLKLEGRSLAGNTIGMISKRIREYGLLVFLPMSIDEIGLVERFLVGIRSDTETENAKAVVGGILSDFDIPFSSGECFMTP